MVHRRGQGRCQLKGGGTAEVWVMDWWGPALCGGGDTDLNGGVCVGFFWDLGRVFLET